MEALLASANLLGLLLLEKKPLDTTGTADLDVETLFRFELAASGAPPGVNVLADGFGLNSRAFALKRPAIAEVGLIKPDSPDVAAAVEGVCMP